MATSDDRNAWTSLLLFERYRDGDEKAAAELFDRYFQRLTALARSRLSPRVAQRTDPEDIVLSVYRSFFIAARDGRYSLHRGGDLWRLLAAIAKHKLLRQSRRDAAGRRSVEAEVPLDRTDEASLAAVAADPTPDEAAALTDELELVLSRLEDLGRRVLELRLQGYQLSEIAEDTGVSERSVRRSLARIKELLTRPRDDE